MRSHSPLASVAMLAFVIVLAVAGSAPAAQTFKGPARGLRDLADGQRRQDLRETFFFFFFFFFKKKKQKLVASGATACTPAR